MDFTAGCKVCLVYLILTLQLFLGDAMPKTIKVSAIKGFTQKLDADDRASHGESVTVLGDEGFLEIREREEASSRKSTPLKDKQRKVKPQGHKVKSQNKKTEKTWQKHGTFHTRKSPIQTCVPISLPMCRDLDLYHLSQYPNHLGHHTEQEAAKALLPFMPLLKDPKCGEAFRKLSCLLYAPQCSGTDEPLLPCKMVCQTTKDVCSTAMNKTGLKWPSQWRCGRFSDDGLCVDPYTKVTPVPEPKLNKHLEKTKNHLNTQIRQSQSSTSDRPIKTHLAKPRNYNIRQLGQSELFHGWADVQGQGAANDYCRVIGKNPSSWFLSCSLGGTTHSDHVFVSKRGFDVGHRHTWFMKDADGDGKDDYCRCVGKGLKSFVSCMKAGEFGFYGSPQEPGNEYTFTVKTDAPCFHKTVNPYFGI